MTQFKTIFDMTSLTDLPDLIRSNLDLVTKKKKKKTLNDKLLELFEISEKPISLDEIVVGYYRLFKEIPKRESIKFVLYKLTTDNKLFVSEMDDRVYSLKNKVYKR